MRKTHVREAMVESTDLVPPKEYRLINTRHMRKTHVREAIVESTDLVPPKEYSNNLS